MNSLRDIPMLRLSTFGAVLVASFTIGGCNLDVQNPNAPDKNRAFTDPAGLQQLIGGAFRTWVEARGGYYVMPLSTMADNYTASWNNAAIRFYSSVGVECPSRCGWTNSATASDAGLVIEAQWYGYYSVLSSANDVLAGINDGICFDDDCAADSTTTMRNKAVAKMLQGMALAGIALIYDQGFIVDETTVLPDDPAAYPPFSIRGEVRDAALQKFEDAYALAGMAGIGAWSTPAEWMGVGAGTPYTKAQIRSLIRTMEAELIAMYPRNSGENAAADWTAVQNYASQGVSSGTAFDWKFFVDVTGRECGIECVKTWGNSIGTMRVDTRVARMLDSLSQENPWPGAPGTVPNPLTRLTAAITANASPQAVTPLSMTNIVVGRQITVGCAPGIASCAEGEKVVVTAVTATTFSAVFTLNHPGPTTLSAAITKDTVPQAATPASMAGIAVGSLLVVEADTSEAVTVKSVTATTFTALFKRNHLSGVTIAQGVHRNGGSPGNTCPTNSPDKRLGDGTYGLTDNFNGYSTKAKTVNAGTDYACSGVAIFPPARGQYHQSNLQHVRYQNLAYRGENLPGSDGTGQDPLYTTQMNDLLWAEGLIRMSGGDLNLAAQKIDNSRVTRGGLSTVVGQAAPALLTALAYEQEIEFMGQGATAFFNRRRVDGLLAGTPRHMPVPAKEMDVLRRSSYTFGGPTFPDMAPGVGGSGGGNADRPTVTDRWHEVQATTPSRRPLLSSRGLFAGRLF